MADVTTVLVRLANCCFVATFTTLLVCVGHPALAHQHGLAMHGDPKYQPTFENLEYVNPHAPKGGHIRHGVAGTFDNLNPFTLKGVAARGRHLVFESLLKRSWDEPFSLYGLVASSVEVPDDRTSATFVLRPEARFHDGSPVTVDDVIFSWETLKDHGRPNHRFYYGKVTGIERLGPLTIRFAFDSAVPDRELPLIIGLMPLLSKSYFADATFEKTTLDPPLGSGPYFVEHVDPGRRITYRRNPDYWARHLPINVGQYNFDQITYDYYRDDNAMMEAFRAGEYDLRQEYSEQRWALSYDFPAVRDGRVQLAVFPHGRPSGMFALALNARRAIFRDRTVRRALAHAFDFDWVNRTLLHGAYLRTESVFDNSELAADGIPEGLELEVLEPYRDQLPEELFQLPYRPPVADKGLRANLMEASRLLESAGWEVLNGALRQSPDGPPMAFEILLVDPSLEKIGLAIARNLARLGVDVRIRTVDTPQYQYRLNVFDFDAVMYRWGTSLSPGNEQAYYWGSLAATQAGTRNYSGIRDPVVDDLIDRMTQVRTRDTFVAIVRALDRVLLWGHHFIPLYHLNEDRVAYWNKFGRPETTPLYGYVPETWWMKD